MKYLIDVRHCDEHEGRKYGQRKPSLEEVTPELSFEVGNEKKAAICLGCEARNPDRVPELL